MMELEKIIADLTEKFKQPKPVFYNRRILFWFDERGKFANLATAPTDMLSYFQLIPYTDAQDAVFKALAVE